MIRKPNLRNFGVEDTKNLEKALIACRVIHFTQKRLQNDIRDILLKRNSGKMVDTNKVWMQILELNKIFEKVKDDNNISLMYLIQYSKYFIRNDGTCKCKMLVKSQVSAELKEMNQAMEIYQAIQYGTLHGILDMCKSYRTQGISADKRKKIKNIDIKLDNTINLIQSILDSCDKTDNTDIIALLLTKRILQMYEILPQCVQEDLFDLTHIRNKVLQHFDSDYLYQKYMEKRKDFDIIDNVEFTDFPVFVNADYIFSCLSGAQILCDLAQQIQKIINYVLVQAYQTYVKSLNYADVKLNFILRQIQVEGIVQSVNVFHTNTVYYLADVKQNQNWENCVKIY